MADPATANDPIAGAPRGRLIERHPWLIFVLPLAVYMLVGSFEPTPDKPGGQGIGLAIEYAYYPVVYALKLAATIAAIVFVWPGYREFPRRIGWLGVTVGIVGVVAWIGLTSLDIERRYLVPLLEPIGLAGLIDAGARSGFNPLVQIATPAWAYAFLVVRFVGLVAIVPLVEEFFYRGLVMRYPVRHEWWTVPQGETTALGFGMAVLLPVAMHPAELLAAAVWFGLVAWLYVRTRNIWECVAAHAVTNLLLGLYVLGSGRWELM